MEHPYPRRRQDIRVTDQMVDDEKIYIVADETYGRYYQFRDIEFDIFWNLDGETSIPLLKEKIEGIVGDIEIPLEDLESFVDDLKDKGLLEGAVQEKVKESIWQNLFYLRFKAFDPDKLLDSLVTPLSFLFTPPFVILGLILIAWSLSYSFVHRDEWLTQATSLFHGEGLLMVYFALLIVAFVHEMGHALTCKYYGGKVKEMGFMLIYFQPAFYANVTDAYLFREKMHKAYVGAAGLFFQFFFGAFVIAAWCLSIPGSTFSTFLVGMMGMSGFTAFWNFNPLIKLDGYYVLSDLLGVTNLRSNSFRYLGLLLQSWLLESHKATEELETIPPRQRKIYFYFGVGAILYTSFFLGLFFIFILKFLVHELSGLGLLIFIGGISWSGWNWYEKGKAGKH